MAYHVHAGVFWKEIDLSNYIPALSSTQFGIVGTASKGPINQRTLISTVDQLVRSFGYQHANFPALDAAMEYLKEGNQLWFIRTESTTNPAVAATASVNVAAGGTVSVPAKDKGTFYNSLSMVITHGSAKNATDSALGDGTAVALNLNVLGTTHGRVVPGSVKVKLDGALVANDNSSGAFTETGTTNFVSGTVNYATGAIVTNWATAPIIGAVVTVEAQFYSTFSVAMSKTLASKSYQMESFKNLSMVAGSANDYTTILTHSFLLGSFTLTSFPAAGTYTFSGGDDGITGIAAADYIGINLGNNSTGLQLFINPDVVDINAVAVPGVYDDAVVQALLSIAETRRDCMALIDPPTGLDPATVVDWADGANVYAAQNAINTSYAALYYPWVETYDSYNAVSRLVPPSGFAAAAFARTDRVAGEWYAPAGGTRGKLLGSTGTERPLERGEMDFLYENRVNPVNDFRTTGILLWGQRTTQVAPTTLDRINARRLLIMMEKVIVTACQPLVFEPNNKYTWNRLVTLVQPYLDSLVAKGALYEGRVVCDDTVNTPVIIDRNEMVANIFLKITKTAEIITLNFVLLPTGASIDEYIGQQF